APRLLGRRGQTLLAQDVASLVRVSVRLHERALAVHHARARLLPELAHGFRRNAHAFFLVRSMTRTKNPGLAPGPLRSDDRGRQTVGAGTGAEADAGAADGVAALGLGRGAGSAPGAGFSTGGSPRASRSARPASTASPTLPAKRRMARSASSLPGMSTSTSSGSQFVSTTPTTGILSLRASATAIASLRVSITNTASGTLFMALMPERFFSSLPRSFSRRA